MVNLLWNESAPLFQSRRKYLTRYMSAKGVEDREEGKKGGALEREEGDGLPFLFPFRSFLPTLSPSPFCPYHAGDVCWMFEINELHLMLSFLAVFFTKFCFGWLPHYKCLTSKKCSTSISKKKNMALYTGFSSRVRYFANQDSLYSLLSRKNADLLHM